MNKRERLEKTIAGEPTDRVPVALWRHWPGDDQRPADLAQAVIDFQNRWDFDFVKVTPASSYCITDYGAEDEWVGHLEGTRQYTKRAVEKPEDWYKLGKLDPTAGHLGNQLETLRLVKAGLKDDAPLLHTIFNPLSQIKNIAGADRLLEHMRRHPAEFKAGLETITENILRYIDALQQNTEIDGIFYAIQHASHAKMSEEEYLEFGKPYDQRILEALPQKWWFNMAHLHGPQPMFNMVSDYPVQAINWHDRETTPSLETGSKMFGGAACGGLGHWDAVHNGTPEDVRKQACDAILQTEGRSFILSTGCVLITTSPVSNIRMVREVVDDNK
jgi:uroporphyrinogen decarboxylase